MAKAKKPLTPATKPYVKYGYGQVEGNKLSARYNGKIFASLPCEKSLTVVENGMFLCYDYAKKLVTKPGATPAVEPMLVFNEVKIYDPWETEADFAMLAENYTASIYNATANGKYAHVVPGPGEAADRILAEYDNRVEMKNGADNMNPYGMMSDKANAIFPRLFKTDIGDIMTTNCINLDEKNAEDLKIGVILTVGEDGYLKPNDAAEDTEMQWQIVQVYTMPDLQPGVKIFRVK